MKRLIPHCPGQRTLVHGDFGFGNVLAQDGQITTVLYWMNVRYGDALYDVAWLNFWAPDDQWLERYRESRRDNRLTSYAERVACYQHYIALDALRFFAKGQHRRGYDWVRQRILSLAP